MTVKSKFFNNFLVQFGNVVRLKKVKNMQDRAIWYSGADTVTILDTQSHQILKRLTGVIEALPRSQEPFGYFDVFNENMLVVSTYGMEKKMFYLHDIDSNQRVHSRRGYNDQFFSKLEKPG